MGIYSTLYSNICDRGRQRKSEYRPGSGLHLHHIVPKHAGGLDEETNYTYLYSREHKIVHFLRWKLFGEVNDLRSMYMLGAELTAEQRRIVGLWCQDNGVGFFSASDEDRAKWRAKGLETQRQSGSENTFYFWSTEEGRTRRASMGGKIGAKNQIKNHIGIHTDDTSQRSEWARLGGKAHVGKIWINRSGEMTRIWPDEFEAHAADGWKRGTGRIKRASDI